MYSEAAAFHLLTLVFPTMRLWSGRTISQMIEWLCDLNRFFGLQPESMYYSPLVQRVQDIQMAASFCNGDKHNSNMCELVPEKRAKKLLLTGHSLGIFLMHTKH